MIMQNVHRIDMEVQLNALTSQFTSLLLLIAFSKIRQTEIEFRNSIIF